MAAGLHLAALSLRGRERVDELIESFAGSDRRIVDYLGAEVLEQQPGHLAAGWLLDAGLISEAVRQLVAAGDMDGAADVVVTHWLAFVNAGERAMVAECLDAIPDERVLADGYTSPP